MKIKFALTKFEPAKKLVFLPIYKSVKLSLKKEKLHIKLHVGLRERTLQHWQYLILLEKLWIYL